MNAIDAHKDELESLLVNLARDAGVSRTDFVALLDAYIKRLDKKLHRRQSTRRFGAATNRRKTNMEPTLTQNCALYYAQHTIPRHRPALFRRFRAAARSQIPRHRPALFRRFRAAARSQTPCIQRQMTRDELFRRLPLYRDNGR